MGLWGVVVVAVVLRSRETLTGFVLASLEDIPTAVDVGPVSASTLVVSFCAVLRGTWETVGSSDDGTSLVDCVASPWDAI